jgi:hypothetical protein
VAFYEMSCSSIGAPDLPKQSFEAGTGSFLHPWNGNDKV